MSVKRVAIEDIEVDKNLFLREGLDSDAIERYKQQYKDGMDLDPLVVQKETLKLLDGFHRYQALDKLGRDYIKVQIVDTDNPLKEAARRNTEHGVPYSKEERNKIIGKLYYEENHTQKDIGEIFSLSQNRISEILGLSIADITYNSKKPDERSDRESKEPIGSSDKRRALNKAEESQVVELSLKGRSQAETAESFGISQPRVSQIHSDFKNDLCDRYASGYPVDMLIEDSDGVDIKRSQVIDILKESDSLESDLVEVPRLIHGDMFEEIDRIPNGSIDVITTDPPYNITEEEWDQFDDYWVFTKKWLKAVLPKLKDDGRLYVCFSQENMWKFHTLMEEIREGFDLVFGNLLIWNYKNNIKPHDKRKYKYTWEPVFYYFTVTRRFIP